MGDKAYSLPYMVSMPKVLSLPPNVRSVSAKEISVLAWIQDAFGNVLVIRQRAGKQLWTLPGGKVRSAEGLKRALSRELKEEIGLSVVSARVVDLFDRPLRSGLAVLFVVKLRAGKLKLGENEIQDAAFVGKLPTNATPSLKFFWKRRFSAGTLRGNCLDL
jgi:ADP-ribose pyrophosphatase YjhB (NUDIX family)